MDKLNNYIVESINGSKLNLDPFPYLYVENIFPPDFYQVFESYFPPRDALFQAGTKKTHNALIDSRFSFPLFDKDMETFPKINEFKQILSWMKLTLLPTVGSKLQIDYNVNNSPLRGAFVIDEPGYLKRPHTDHPSKIFTLLLYMSHSPTGTTILRPKQVNYTDPDGTDHPYRDFDEVQTVTFKPNSLLAFKRTNNSFHCVRKVTDPAPRKAFHIHVWNPS